MNRLSPLIVRRAGRFAPAAAFALPLRSYFEDVTVPSNEDIRLFATAFLGGLVFFGAFLA